VSGCVGTTCCGFTGVDYGADPADGRPITFRRELLNTCQDEFEAMEAQRAVLVSGPGGVAGANEDARRKVKMRTLGTIRLLAELFNKELVTQVRPLSLDGGCRFAACCLLLLGVEW
jgi:hypothetical protein